MKLILIAVVVAILLGVVIYTSSPKDQTKRIEKLLSSLPDRISIVHTPEKVMANKGGRSGRNYTWLHETAISSKDGKIEVQEFGALVWHEGEWIFSSIYDRPFNEKEFEEWYGCPNAVLVPGEVFKDEMNYTGGDSLRPSKSKWYVIGKSESRKLVKGVAVVESLAKSTQVEA